MFSCEEIWRAIELLAERNQITMSRLAIQAGLDATALNMSKRTRGDGTQHWPSTSTLSKILLATQTTLMEFAALVESTPAEASADDPAPRRRGTILLVEDDDTLGAASAAILRGAGYRVHFAQNHQTALAVLAGSEPIDLLLTDVVMPAGLGGVALARIAHKHRPGIKVVYNTAYDIPGLAETGCDIVLLKPVDREQLLSTVGRSIDASQQADKLH